MAASIETDVMRLSRASSRTSVLYKEGPHTRANKGTCTKWTPVLTTGILIFICKFSKILTWHLPQVILTSKYQLPVMSAPYHQQNCNCHHPWSWKAQNLLFLSLRMLYHWLEECCLEEDDNNFLETSIREKGKKKQYWNCSSMWCVKQRTTLPTCTRNRSKW